MNVDDWSRNSDREPVPKGATYLVASEAPDGMVVHTEFGVFRDLHKSIAERLDWFGVGYQLQNPQYMRGDEIGLEWRLEGTSHKIDASDSWAKTNYLIVSKARGNEVRDAHGQLRTSDGIQRDARRQEGLRLLPDGFESTDKHETRLSDIVNSTRKRFGYRPID